MNCDTGELIRLLGDNPEVPAGFKCVPDEFKDLAEELLDSKDIVIVDMGKTTPLTIWAKQNSNRKDLVADLLGEKDISIVDMEKSIQLTKSAKQNPKRKNKAKMAKQSKKRNRR